MHVLASVCVSRHALQYKVLTGRHLLSSACFSTSYSVKSDPDCHSHSFSQLNGVKEPSLLLGTAITIRLGGRGNEQRSTRCTFQPPAIVKSTLLQTEWQQGTGWEAGVTCQEHPSSKSQFLMQTSTRPSQLPLATKMKKGFTFLLLNTWKLNKQLYGKLRARFVVLALCSFICKVVDLFFFNSVSQHSVSCATVCSQEAHFQTLSYSVITEESKISLPCLPCLSSSF